jgi:hypothetical protein
VTFNGTLETSTSTTIVYSVYPGTYGYTVGTVANYNAAPSSGNVVVTGANVNVPITWTHAPVPYTVTFTETGLPTGTLWQVTLGSSTKSSNSTTIVFSELNNTYLYSVLPAGLYNPSPNGGTVTVAGAPVAETITFSTAPAGTYAVVFTASGLTTGTNWSVTIGASTVYSDGGATVTFNEANGSYAYTVNAVAGYTLESPTGNVQVTGQPAAVAVTFVPITYAITFTESGLATGTTWTVTIGTDTKTSTTTTIVFDEVNGTHAYTIGSVSGYSVGTASGSVDLTGAPQGVQVTFTANGGGGSTSSSGLSTLDWAIIGIVIALLVIVLVVALVMRGRGGAAARSGAPPPTTESNQEVWSEEPPPGNSS